MGFPSPILNIALRKLLLKKTAYGSHVQIQNTGKRLGKEVVQVYVSKSNSTIDRPLQELKAFTKTTALEPGATEVVQLVIPVSDIRYWDETKTIGP